MSSGVGVSKEAENALNDVVQRKLGIAVFKMNDGNTEIILETTRPIIEDGNECLNELKSILPPKEPRYAIMDFNTSNDDGHKRDKYVFVGWSPDCAMVKPKMLYASSKNYMLSLVNNAKVIQATDSDDISYDEVRKVCLK